MTLPHPRFVSASTLFLSLLLGALPASVKAGPETPRSPAASDEPRPEGGSRDGSTEGVYGAIYFGSMPFRVGPVDGGTVTFDRLGSHDTTIASVDASGAERRHLWGFGMSLGYFPPLFKIQPSSDFYVAPGLNTRFGANFGSGWGADLAGGPEVLVQYQRVRVSLGYTGGFGGFGQRLGTLQLDGQDTLVVANRSPPASPCSEEEFNQGASGCVRHDERSVLRHQSNYWSHGPHLRVGYRFFGILVGYRTATPYGSPSIQLVNRAQDRQESAVHGNEVGNLNRDTNFQGVFVALELFNQPF